MSFDSRPRSELALLLPALITMATAAGAETVVENPALEEVLVSAHRLTATELLRPHQTLSGEQLESSRAATLGETVAQLPGVHNAGFGPGVGRPVINGQGGVRVRVLEDRIGALDASAASPDHAVSVEPWLTERIEVITGPGALLYGSGAVGGVVDVHSGRIPHERPQRLGGRIELRGDDATGQRTAAARLDGGGNRLAWHLDATARDTDDADIPGLAESPRQLAAEGERGDESERGRLSGSDTRLRAFAGGGSLFFGADAFVGAAVSRLEREYGLVGGHAHAHEEDHEADDEEGHDHEGEAEGNPWIDLEQSRFDLEINAPLERAGLENLNVRFGYNDYEHREIEPSGAIATTFEISAIESRAELAHDPIGGWRGVVGLQFLDRDFSALGEEAFLTPTRTRALALFAVEDRSIASMDLELSGRLERVDHARDRGGDRGFTVGGVSAGIEWPIGANASLVLLTDVSRRAPAAEELYSQGPHLATSSFDIGDPDLDPETAFNLSATLGWTGAQAGAALMLFGTRFTDYIFARPTGGVVDELTVLQWSAADADFTGVNASGWWEAWRDGAASVRMEFGFDWLDSSLDSATALPRQPPMRTRIGAIGTLRDLRVELQWMRVSEQTQVARFELPTGGYDDLRLRIEHGWERGETRIVAFVAGHNLTDDEQREHTSFVKDFAPRPGRRIEAGLRMSF